MERFKKKTLALVLASVVTVVGSFAAGNYKNTVMSLKFESSDAGSVNMTILTKTPYGESISPKKKDQNTYVIMLPEINSKMEQSPSLSGNIESVDVKTMPYTSSSNGYTKITVKTSSDIALNAKNGIFIPEEKPKESISDKQLDANAQRRALYKRQVKESNGNEKYDKQVRSSKTQQRTEETRDVSRKRKSSYDDKTSVVETRNDKDKQVSQQPLPTKPAPKENPTDEFLLLGAFFVITMVTIYLYIKTKRKMAEMIGDQSDLDFSDDKKEKNDKKESSSKQIKSAISALDQMYKKPIKMPINNVGNSFGNTTANNSEPIIQEDNIVDLDELFQKQSQASKESSEEDNDENEALEAFLSGFSFDDEVSEEEETDTETEPWQNQELYDKYLNNDKFKFSEEDVDKMNSLLNSEVSENAIKELSKASPVTTPNTKPSKKEILEDFVTSFAIKQDITFTKEDIEALNKLISVELDNDFISDLRTNPERANSMRREIEERSVSASRKVNEILTLNVKDMLPDLGEALKKQGNKRIESEAKPEVVYFSEGYEYTTLSIKNELPDLSSEINLKSNTHRPSDIVEYAVTGYDTPKLNVDGLLPDLNDVMANPEKYEEKPKPKVKPISEKDLLKNIDNVTFKPFDDGNNNFEMINNPEDFENIDENNVRKEFEQFENFTVVEEQDIAIVSNDNSAYEDLYENDYYDLDKDKNQEQTPVVEPVAEIEKPIVPEPEVPKIEEPIIKKEIPTTKAPVDRTEPVIQETVVQKPEPPAIKAEETPKEEKQETTATPNICVIDGESFKILNSQEFNEKMGCYLAKNDKGYAVLGYVKDRIFKLKEYETLNSERLHARISEKLPDGISRYIVRIGLHKFILNVTDDNMEYIMALC